MRSRLWQGLLFALGACTLLQTSAMAADGCCGGGKLVPLMRGHSMLEITMSLGDIGREVKVFQGLPPEWYVLPMCLCKEHIACEYKEGRTTDPGDHNEDSGCGWGDPPDYSAAGCALRSTQGC